MHARVLSRSLARSPEGTPRVVVSVREWMLLLVLACLVPAGLIAAVVLAQAYTGGRQMMVREASSTARTLSMAVDGQVAVAIAALESLATSPALESGDLVAFQHQADRLLTSQHGNNVVLTDLQGHQRMNTLRPPGSSLPDHGDPAFQRRVIEADRPIVSDLFRGGVTRRPLVAVEIPVRVHGALAYTLAMGFFPDRLGAMLAAVASEPDAVISVFDRRGVTVARNRLAERYVGQPGVPAIEAAMKAADTGTLELVTLEGTPAISGFHRSSATGWTVAVAVPRAILLDRLYKWLAWLLASTVVVLTAAAALAAWIGARISYAIGQLVGCADALGRGEVPAHAPSSLREVNQVGEAMTRAGELLQSRTQERDHATRDSREAHDRARQFEHAAEHDPLTGLMNRGGFARRLEDAIAEAAASGSPLALVYADIDDFKPVNDRHGHAVGDELLRHVAERLRGGVRDSDVLSRVGGDEFVLLLPGLAPTEAHAIAGALRRRLSRPFVIRDLRLEVHASAGVACFPDDGSTAHALLEVADARMYAAKALRKANGSS